MWGLHLQWLTRRMATEGLAAMSDWAGVETVVAAIVHARPDEYDLAVRENLVELLDLLRAINRPAPDISPGYYPTFRVRWDLDGSHNLEIEIFDDRYEVYRFFNGETRIWYEYHRPGETFSLTFLSELPQPA